MKKRVVVTLVMILALMAMLAPVPLAALDGDPVINSVQLPPGVEAINVAPCAGLTSAMVTTNITGGTPPYAVHLLWRDPSAVWGGRKSRCS